jgi:MOSC domain-containing protein YiiM
VPRSHSCERLHGVTTPHRTKRETSIRADDGPIEEASITALGIRGDSWAHPNFTAAPTSLLLITSEGIAELSAQGFPLYPGALGENLTTAGIDRRQMRVGQRYREPVKSFSNSPSSASPATRSAFTAASSSRPCTTHK